MSSSFVLKGLFRATRILIIIMLVVSSLLPLYWGLVTSLKPTNDILKVPPELVPQVTTVEHYQHVLQSGRLTRSIGNSFVSTLSAVILCVPIAALAGYALYRYRFPGRRLYMITLLSTMLISRVALLIPIYFMFSDIGLIDNLFGLGILYTVFALPFTTMMIEGSFSAIPSELEDAALVDGCTQYQAFRKVVLPLVTPGLAAAAVYVFVQSWNDFITAAIVINDPEKMTVMLTVRNYIGFFGRDWGGLTAASILSLIPILVFFGVLQQRFISGMTAGAVK